MNIIFALTLGLTFVGAASTARQYATVAATDLERQTNCGCGNVYDPVCTREGREFQNVCFARCAGEINVAASFCSTGNSCTSVYQCGERYECLNNRCQVNTGGNCVNQIDCAVGYMCMNRRCSYSGSGGAQTSCISSDNCASGYVCSGGQCLPQGSTGGNLPDGSYCISANECLSNVCTNNRCQANGLVDGSYCTSARECASNNCLNNRCQASNSGGGLVDGSYCTFATDCASNNCRDNRCQASTNGLPDGSYCTTPRECASSICTNNRCTAGGGGSTCNCNGVVGNPVCTPRGTMQNACVAICTSQPYILGSCESNNNCRNCPTDYKPVCALGTDYNNVCQAICQTNNPSLPWAYGTCRTPTNCQCPAIYDPVCYRGSTYGSVCSLRCINPSATGYTQGECGGGSTCESRCGNDNTPVCANGRDYRNRCYAQCAGATNVVNGACGGSGNRETATCNVASNPVCARGQTYATPCRAINAGHEVFTFPGCAGNGGLSDGSYCTSARECASNNCLNNRCQASNSGSGSCYRNCGLDMVGCSCRNDCSLSGRCCRDYSQYCPANGGGGGTCYNRCGQANRDSWGTLPPYAPPPIVPPFPALPYPPQPYPPAPYPPYPPYGRRLAELDVEDKDFDWDDVLAMFARAEVEQAEDEGVAAEAFGQSKFDLLGGGQLDTATTAEDRQYWSCNCDQACHTYGDCCPDVSRYCNY